MIKRYITSTLIISAILFATSCSGNTDKENTNNSLDINKAFLRNVKTTTAILSDQLEELTLTGKVEYDPDNMINYVPLINGVVERSYFALGDKVQKGQTLIDIRSTELSSLQAELITLESEVKIAQRELKTAQAMFEDNMLSEKELMEALGKVDQAQAALNRVRTDMSFWGSNKSNGSFSIKAPMSGYIINKNASSGTPVSSDSEPLFSIADLNTVWITVNVYASNLLFVKEGMDVKITSLSYPGDVFIGKINTLSQVFDPEEKVLKARIVMPNKDLKLKPEMSVLVKLENKTNKRLVAIPSDALIFDANRYFVVVEESADNFKIKEVTVQGHNKDTSYIASGLLEGEYIVIKNQLLIYSGLKEN
ncbi:efflux RND transporter periplasmic adaptor subunit [Dysgonomonas sp. ZJ279]|uniref:efflux RND transporter periplasmic adaptor subunit n=1 Tax=Dysgonomonas sp. ZJ279 TaxID=2709796 RepID=UPI0013EBF8DD|nr:efflux RND transporter periplasmic adaptor subunit [Dysgonomonas sp. ZJ279]